MNRVEIAHGRARVGGECPQQGWRKGIVRLGKVWLFWELFLVN